MRNGIALEPALISGHVSVTAASVWGFDEQPLSRGRAQAGATPVLLLRARVRAVLSHLIIFHSSQLFCL